MTYVQFLLIAMLTITSGRELNPPFQYKQFNPFSLKKKLCNTSALKFTECTPESDLESERTLADAAISTQIGSPADVCVAVSAETEPPSQIQSSRHSTPNCQHITLGTPNQNFPSTYISFSTETNIPRESLVVQRELDGKSNMHPNMAPSQCLQPSLALSSQINEMQYGELPPYLQYPNQSLYQSMSSEWHHQPSQPYHGLYKGYYSFYPMQYLPPPPVSLPTLKHPMSSPDGPATLKKCVSMSPDVQGGASLTKSPHCLVGAPLPHFAEVTDTVPRHFPPSPNGLGNFKSLGITPLVPSLPSIELAVANDKEEAILSCPHADCKYKGTFQNVDYLRRHIKEQHISSREHKCKGNGWGCGKSFKRPYQLVNHWRGRRSLINCNVPQEIIDKHFIHRDMKELSKKPTRKRRKNTH